MRALLLGAGGMLGCDLVRAAPGDVDLVTRPEPRLDITNYSDVNREFDRLGPQCVINATGYTAVDKAESEEEGANRVNGAAVGNLAKTCSERGVTLVHFSTDYVFSGKKRAPYAEDDPQEPLSAYGRSKAIGEGRIASSGARALVIRSQWLFGLHGRSFPRTMLQRACARIATRVVNDQIGRPTYTRDLAAWTWALIGNGEVGVIHAANDGTATWFEVAQEVFARAGALECLSPCTTPEYPTPATRPAYSVLDTSRLRSILGTPSDWRDALRRFLRELEAAPPA